MTDSFEAWISAQMAARSVKSARRLGLEAGLDPDRVADWMLGTSMPTDAECEKLADYFGVPVAEVRDRRLPGRRHSGA